MSVNLRTTVFLLMATHVSITGCGYVVVKLALREFNSLSLAFWRFTIGLAALLAYMMLRRAWPKIERSDWLRVIALGIIAIPVNQLFYLIGMQHTVPSHASLLYASTAAFALLMSAAVGYERLKFYKFFAIALAICGVVIVVFRPGIQLLHPEYLRGDLIILAAVISWAAYTVVAKPVVKKYGALSLSMFCLIIGSILAIPFLIPAALEQDYSQITWIGWSAILYTGVMLTAVAYTVWFALIKLIDPSQVAILTAPQPVVATTVSAIVIGEALGLPLLLGGMLVIAGVLMMDFPALIVRRKQRRLSRS